MNFNSPPLKKFFFMSTPDEIEPEDSYEAQIWEKESELCRLNDIIRGKHQELRKLRDTRFRILEFIEVMKRAKDLKRQVDANLGMLPEEEVPTQVFEKNEPPVKRHRV